METIKRYVLNVEVLYRESDTDLAESFDSLADLENLISDGPCIGDYRFTEVGVVPPDQVRDALIQVGNDGTFFDDEENDGDD